MIRLLAAGATAGILTLAACSSPVATCSASDGLGGRWTYLAQQETPVRGTITGTVVLSSANCIDFQGALDAVEVFPTGETRRLSGAVTGTVVEGTLVTFAASLGSEEREHLARLDGDSIAGTWVESSGGGSGRFSGTRRSP